MIYLWFVKLTIVKRCFMHISPSFHGDKIVVPGGLGFTIAFLQCLLPLVSIWTMVILPRANTSGIVNWLGILLNI